MELNEIDRKGLIREAYRIDGITLGECRSIFLDWALTVSDEVNAKDAITRLLEVYGSDMTHPMSVVLQEGLKEPPKARRRGGRGRRLSGEDN